MLGDIRACWLPCHARFARAWRSKIAKQGGHDGPFAKYAAPDEGEEAEKWWGACPCRDLHCLKALREADPTVAGGALHRLHPRACCSV
eukprot:3680599-Prymnesium_polylepis.2